MSMLEIRPDWKKDPDGRRARELFGAIFNVDRYAALRSLAFHALAVLGLVLWLDVAFPAHFPERVRGLALSGFALIAVGAGIATWLEVRWQRIQRRCMAEEDVKVLDDEVP